MRWSGTLPSQQRRRGGRAERSFQSAPDAGQDGRSAAFVVRLDGEFPTEQVSAFGHTDEPELAQGSVLPEVRRGLKAVSVVPYLKGH